MKAAIFHIPPVPALKPAMPAPVQTASTSGAFQSALVAAQGETSAATAASGPVAAPVPGQKPPAPTTTFIAGAVEHSSAAVQLMRATQQVAGLSGHSAQALLSQASTESRFNPAAKNKHSSAAGPFQFLERTWLDMMRRHGSAYGLGDMARAIQVRQGVPHVADPALRKRILDLRHDVNISAGMAARYMSEGRAALGRSLGRPATETESRIAYVLGVGGAARLIRTAEKTPTAVAAELMPRAAKANSSLFFDRGGRALSASETLATMTRRMDRDYREMFAALPSGTEAAFQFDGLAPGSQQLSDTAPDMPSDNGNDPDAPFTSENDGGSAA